MKTRLLAAVLVPVLALPAGANETAVQLPVPITGVTGQVSPLSSWSLPVTRVVWQSADGVENAGRLLQPWSGQAALQDAGPCVLRRTQANSGAVLVDFGVEVAGSIEIFTPQSAGSKDPFPVRVRFGESVGEAMAETGGASSATNDHALRDEIVALPWMGKITLGQTGFRFVRLDALDPGRPVPITAIRAVMQIRAAPPLGSFRCEDERLNRIWSVGAYTVQLNMQDYLWDGVKRDRLVWVGDMHAETSTIAAVFGFNDVVPRSLDFVRDTTAAGQWMNGLSSYSMWWVVIQEQWWMQEGDRAYLEAQRPALRELLPRLIALVGPDGREHVPGMRFLDWPTSPNAPAVSAGLQALLTLSLDRGARLLRVLGEQDLARACDEAAGRARQADVDPHGSKAATALLVLAGMMNPQEAAVLIEKGGPKDLSTFTGFYVLTALAEAGEIDPALDFIRRYWGGMLDFGGTTFWEDFDLAWTENAARIDELTPPGKKDLHGDFGGYCYVGYRRSLCHGWASGPTPWLSATVLGITPLEPGCRVVRIKPQLGSLRWAEGSYPTPLGPITVRHERQPDGKITSRISAPPGVRVVRDQTPAGASRQK